MKSASNKKENIKNGEIETIYDALQEIVRLKGQDILLNKNLIISMLSDIAPKLKLEKRQLQIIMENTGVWEKIYQGRERSAKEQKRIITQCYRVIVEDLGMKEEFAIKQVVYIANLFSYDQNCLKDLFNISNKVFTAPVVTPSTNASNHSSATSGNVRPPQTVTGTTATQSNNNTTQTRVVKKEAVKKKIIIAIVATIVLICGVAFLSNNHNNIQINNTNNSEYNAAVALINSGDYIAAYETLDNLNGYKDSESLKASIKSDYKNALFNAAEVGSTVYFGSYEQDNDTSNGNEDIEWIVLAKDGTKILVISKYGLDYQKYNNERTSVTWETCTLRAWLNSTFISTAFSSEESTKISTVTVTADESPHTIEITGPGNNTQDQVFLLSIAEAEKYFDSDDSRKCVPTEYTIAKGRNKGIGKEETNCLWWLRTLGIYKSFATQISTTGAICSGGWYVDEDYVCVRPTLWINLDY